MGRLAAAALLLLSAVLAGACSAEAPEEEDVDDNADAYTVSALPREVNRRVAKCFVADWTGRDAALRTDARYVGGGFAPTLGLASSAAFHGIGHLIMLGSEGEAVLRTLEGDLREIAQQQHLDDAQKALVTACVSSELISYAANGTSKLLGAAAAVGAYEGVCTEYAAIYARLLSAAGVEAGRQVGRVNGGGHAWNWLELEGRRVWIEPQMNPLRMRGPSFFDPTGKAAAAESSATCLPPGAQTSEAGACCSGVTSGSGGAKACAAPSCEATGTAICVPSSGACSGIGGAVRTSSCGASRDGATCCAFASSR